MSNEAGAPDAWADWSPFARDIAQQKYCHTLRSGRQETWPEVGRRVARAVLGAVDADQELVDEVAAAIANREFLPAGRYLYAAGRPFHQVQNCLLLRADDSREGWADLMRKGTMALMTGAGIGVVYSDVRPEGALIRKTGGHATGPCALMKMLNEAGRYIMQGGSRRSAIWAGLHWNHPDVVQFATMKNWSEEVRALKAKDYNFPATMDGTNISVILDDLFFKAYTDAAHRHHALAHNVYWTVVRQMLKTAEPGFSVDVGENTGENLRNAPVCGATMVLTRGGYQQVTDLIGKPKEIWTGLRWAPGVVFKQTSLEAQIIKVSMTGGREIRCDKDHPFLVERYKGAGERRKLEKIERISARLLQEGDVLHVSCPQTTEAAPKIDSDAYTLGYVYGDGSFTNHGGAAEITFCTEASKICAEQVRWASRLSSMNMSDGRGFVRCYFHTDREYWGGRAKDIFPTDAYSMSAGHAASFLAGLFDSDGNWEPQQKRIRLSSRHEAFLRGAARLLEQLGIMAGVSRAGTSTFGQAQGYQLVVQSDSMTRFAHLIPTIRIKPELDGYKPYRAGTVKVLSIEEDGLEPVYCADVGVPEHSFMAEGVIISNCTEITSRDDSDICNLGSINMARVPTLERFRRLVELGTLTLLAGTVYSDVPYAKVDEIRRKNRRLGLGLMGVHEWLLKRGKRYGPDPELETYLRAYVEVSDAAAVRYAQEWGLSVPLKKRAMAPNGTIGIVAGPTTTSMEPMLCAAYKRRHLKGNVVNFQYVIEPVAQQLVDAGVRPEDIEDAYTLAEDPERRVAFQAWFQQYVDHAISSTINLPAWGTAHNNAETVQGFGDMLVRYLPMLRGITCYPDGARGGQPLTPVKFATAVRHVGEVYEEYGDVCTLTRGGACGS